MLTTYTFPKKENDPQNYYYYLTKFSIEELGKIDQDLNSLNFEEATVIGDGNEAKKIRSSRLKWIPKNTQWEWLYERLMACVIEANDVLWNFNLHHIVDNIQYTEYLASEGGHYVWHQDIGPGSASLRKVSLVVQLAGPDEYGGGDLQYWLGGDNYVTASRDKGAVFVFPSYMMHRVTRVTRGLRRSLVFWVGGEHFQ